jgi:tetratricopeptide (TPR) repeat protein
MRKLLALLVLLAVAPAALAQEKAAIDAAHERALAYTEKSQYAECRGVLQPFVKNATAAEAVVFHTYGNCLEGLGKRDEAIKIYRRGLQLLPRDPQLSFYLAIALMNEDQFDEARELLKTDLRQRPGHASGHFFLGLLFRRQGFRVPAAVELLRFLAIEPTGERAKVAAGQVLELMNVGVTKKSDKNIELKVDPGAPETEGDFTGVEMGWAFAAGAQLTEESAKMSEFERLIDQVASSISMLVEMNENNPGSDFISRTELPFFAALYKAKQIEPFVAVAFSTSPAAGKEAWARKHTDELAAMLKWLGQQRENQP